MRPPQSAAFITFTVPAVQASPLDAAAQSLADGQVAYGKKGGWHGGERDGRLGEIPGGSYREMPDCCRAVSAALVRYRGIGPMRGGPRPLPVGGGRGSRVP